MQIAILGPGAIGSTFAFQLARAGHDVTVVARNARLAQLQRDGAVVLASGDRAPVRVTAALDEGVPYDLVLVTVLAPQVAEILPALARSAARTVMFMFNTFGPLEPLRDAVGAARFAFGFPGGVFALLRNGVLAPQIRAGTTVGEASWARVFSDAGIPTVVDADMHSWLRTHAALVVPLMAASVLVVRRGAGLTWREATRHADALAAGLRLVRDLGNTLRPPVIAALSRLSGFVVTALLWGLSRTKVLRDLGALGPAEARMLIDMMSAAAPGRTAALQAIRP
ncbi:ketopantoate reductase family protein [Sorangium sp. So ce1099]|uniref:ketopantoate reductase family protein n=1 Tax=Sorangium sp. So ce1099 TaxID=3133331 RepID=UPI003F5D58E1